MGTKHTEGGLLWSQDWNSLGSVYAKTEIGIVGLHLLGKNKKITTYERTKWMTELIANQIEAYHKLPRRFSRALLIF